MARLSVPATSAAIAQNSYLVTIRLRVVELAPPRNYFSTGIPALFGFRNKGQLGSRSLQLSVYCVRQQRAGYGDIPAENFGCPPVRSA